MSRQELDNAIKAFKDSLMTEYKIGFDFPEAQLHLNFKDRHGDRVRQIKHITQLSTVHVNNHKFSNELKLLALLENYADAIDNSRVIGIYLYGRTIFELAAFLYDVTARLLDAKEILDKRWKDKGIEFFNTIVRARFGTSNATISSMLIKGKISKGNTKPFNISRSIAKLLSVKKHARLTGKYELLCDYVHHNFSSSSVSVSGVGKSNFAMHSSGGAILLQHDGFINRYSFEQGAESKRAAEQTIDTVIYCLAVCREALKTLPESPYSKEFLTATTGLSSGFIMHR